MPLAKASCSPSQRLVGQVFTSTSTVSNGPGRCSNNCWANSWARNSARLLRYSVSTAWHGWASNRS